MFRLAGVFFRCVLVSSPSGVPRLRLESCRLPLWGGGDCRMSIVVYPLLARLLAGVVVSPLTLPPLPPFDRGGGGEEALAGRRVLLVGGCLRSSPSQRKRQRTAVEEMETIFEMAVEGSKELVSETIDFAD